jgi:large subunit ribosomal protein L24e
MNCNFCGAPIEQGTGKMYIKKDGTVLYFESSKCQRNQVGLGRVNRNVPWTKAAAQAKALLGKGDGKAVASKPVAKTAKK